MKLGLPSSSNHVTLWDGSNYKRAALRRQLQAYPEADKIRVVLDNLNIHKPASLYQAFRPDEEENPHAAINVGIFGEGTDSPSLSSVAFLEARKSPVDVIQAVGRAMRTAPEKEIGYIICPIVIPENVDPEEWLSTSSKEDGWQELGQILVAMRSHDERIEEKLSELMTLRNPTSAA